MLGLTLGKFVHEGVSPNLSIFIMNQDQGIFIYNLGRVPNIKVIVIITKRIIQLNRNQFQTKETE